MKKYRVFNISYDTDGEEIDLPEELEFVLDTNAEPSLELADKISDATGFCVNSFDFQLVK